MRLAIIAAGDDGKGGVDDESRRDSEKGGEGKRESRDWKERAEGEYIYLFGVTPLFLRSEFVSYENGLPSTGGAPGRGVRVCLAHPFRA